MLRGKWWEIYNEPELNALEDQLNINNQTIKQYFQNLMEARALVREARAQYFPTIGTVPGMDPSAHVRQTMGKHNTGGANALNGGQQSSFTLCPST